MRVWGLCLVAAMAVGCGAKAPVDDSFADLAGVDMKADYFSYRLRLLGSLVSDQPVTASYSSRPRFRGYSFGAQAGTAVDIWVRSTDGGDAVAWLLDAQFKVIAKNDDADNTTYDSHLQAVLPTNGNSKSYYVVFRDYDLHRHHFTVTASLRGKMLGPPASGTGDTAQAKAFVPLYQAAGRGFATDSHVIDTSSAPTPVKTAVSDFTGAFGADATITTWRFRAASATAYAVMADAIDSSGSVYVSLFDARGVWVAHGLTRDFLNNPTLSWEYDMEDVTICRCGLAPDGSGAAGCTWVDGVNRPSDVSDCD
jgi:hypothetical protein